MADYNNLKNLIGRGTRDQCRVPGMGQWKPRGACVEQCGTAAEPSHTLKPSSASTSLHETTGMQSTEISQFTSGGRCQDQQGLCWSKRPRTYFRGIFSLGPPNWSTARTSLGTMLCTMVQFLSNHISASLYHLQTLFCCLHSKTSSEDLLYRCSE